MAPKSKLLALSVFWGIGITVVLALIAVAGNSRSWGCTFVWQACLLQAAIIPANSREGTPLDLFLFIFGLLLGVPIYSALTYALFAFWRKSRTGNKQ